MPRPLQATRSFALTLSLAALSLSGCAGGGPGPSRAPEAGVAGRVPEEPAPIRAGRAAAPGFYDDAVDVEHYDLEIWLPPAGGRTIRGRAALRLVDGRRTGQAVLDFTGLAVAEVTVDGQAVPAHAEGGLLTVPLPAGAAADTRVVEVTYRGVPDDGLILGSNVHGRPTAFVDNWPNRARFWFPSVDHPSDKATVSFAVHAPAEWVVVANGRAVGAAEAGADGYLVWRWRTDVAVSAYNMVFGAADLRIIPLGLAGCGGLAPASPRPDGCVEVSAWLYPEDTAQAQLSFARAPEMLDYYARLIGPYPFEKLAHVQSATRFGGMENASAIFYSEGGLASGRDMEGTVAHETAHQWFGDMVTERDWAELWLSEGFATYFGHLFFEETEGTRELRRRMDESRADYLASDVTDQPVITRLDDLFAQLNSNNYPKGGWVLHMLRGILGDEAFFGGVRAYFAEHAGGVVTTSDFRRAMETASGEDLRWFFQQWLREPGYPVLDVEHGWDGAAGEMVLTIRQEQRGDWPTFRLPLEIEVVLADGASERHSFELRERRHVLRLASTGPAVEVRIDPDGWVLKRLSREPGG